MTEIRAGNEEALVPTPRASQRPTRPPAKDVATLFRALLVMLGLLTVPPALGQDGKAAPTGKKRTDINFEDQLIQGELRKPELFYLLQKKQINFGRLIRLRENFIPEMERNSYDVRRGGTSP